MDLEKRAFLEFQFSRLGSELFKLANMMGTALNAAKQLPGAVERAPGMVNRLTHAAPHLNEVAGLGILAAPSVASLAGQPMSEHNSHMAELGGLGVLAGPSAYHAGKSLLGKIPRAIH